MGAHSTINVSRDAALEFIQKKLENISDTELGDLMDVLLYKNLYNVLINDAEMENDDNLLSYLL